MSAYQVEINFRPAVDIITPEIAAHRKVAEVASVDPTVSSEDVYLGYWIGCQAYVECGPDADLEEVVRRAFSIIQPGDDETDWDYVHGVGSWIPEDLDGIISKFAHIGAAEAWWADCGTVVSETSTIWQGRQRVCDNMAAGLSQLFVRRKGE